MKVSNLTTIRMVPNFMQEDEAVKGLSKALDELMRPIGFQASNLRTWDKIDKLSEAELDEMAWELGIEWYYSKQAPIRTKRRLIKNSQAITEKLGTKWAVEQVARDYFGDATVREWFQYGGEPGYFRIYSANGDLILQNIENFTAIIDKIKRCSAWLESVYTTEQYDAVLYVGFTTHQVSKSRMEAF